MSWRSEALALALGLVAAAYAWNAPGTAPETGTGTGTETDTGTETASLPARPERARAPASASRRTSLSGTTPDGALRVTPDGDFIPTPGALRLFDHYLTTRGEIDDATIRTLVAADARRFAPDRADDVLALFDRYTAYLEDLAAALAIAPDLPLSDAHAVTLSRQRAYFGDDADLLFAAENQLAAQLLASSSRKSRSLP